MNFESRKREEKVKTQSLEEFLELLPSGLSRPPKDNYVYGLVLKTYGLCYVGKGKGNRVFDHFSNLRQIAEDFYSGKASDRLNSVYHMILDQMIRKGRSIHHIIIADDLSEEEALRFEKEKIEKTGRLINSTGQLFNLADGGVGVGSGYFAAKDRHQRGVEYQADVSRSNRHQSFRGRPDRKTRLARKLAFGQHGSLA